MEPDGDLLERIRSGGLLEPGRRIVVLLSGGRDSVCLLDVAVRIAGPEAVRALHVDYGLRAAAAGDAAHCRALCDRLGVEIAIRRPDRPGRRQPPGVGARRPARRGRGAGERRRGSPADVATGHTADDQAETILMRLAASPGRRALLGMRPRDGGLIRPLLGIPRASTAAHCRARGLTWREDESNDDPRFARARARHELLPALRELHPAAVDNVVATARLLRDEGAVLDALVADALEGRDTIEVARLRALPRALARLIVIRLAEDAAGTLAPAAGRRLDELLALAPDGGRAALDLGGGVRAVVERRVLRMTMHAVPERPPAPGPTSRRA